MGNTHDLSKPDLKFHLSFTTFKNDKFNNEDLIESFSNDVGNEKIYGDEKAYRNIIKK